ncbi:hypothetical protein ACHQM5_019970 [Ranunculus cassubicifolius]
MREKPRIICNPKMRRKICLSEKDLENLRATMSDDWDDSNQSKEQIEASLRRKQDAALRRERALAYAYFHQQGKNAKSANPMFLDPNKPQWGWSWLERWMAMDGSKSLGKSIHNRKRTKRSFVCKELNLYK